MRFCVLGSGSKGNATLVQSGETSVLIDNGFSGKELAGRLAAVGVAMEDLGALLLTHEHSDHVSGAGVLSRRAKLAVHANEPTFLAAEKKIGKPHRFHPFQNGEEFVVGALSIHPFSLSHDAADPVGFVLTDGRFRFGYCTDTGCVTRLMERRLAGCHALVLEANHDPVMLKNGPYPLELQQRVRGNRGHLSNVDAAGLLRTLLHDSLQAVVLAHLSEQNNLPALAFQEAAAVVTLGAQKRCGVSLAYQHRVGRMVRLQRNGSAVSGMGQEK